MVNGLTVNQVQQSIHAMIDRIDTEDELIRIHRFIQVIYIHKKVGEVAESTYEPTNRMQNIT